MMYGNEPLLPRVSSVEAKPGFILLVTFDNGERKTFEAGPLLGLPIYRGLADVFLAAKVEYGTVTWPGDLDISPDTLYLRGRPA